MSGIKAVARWSVVCSLVLLGGCAGCGNTTTGEDDAGTTSTRDAGSVRRPDASVVALDAAVPPDAAMVPDAAVPPDAALPPDAAVVPDAALPADAALPVDAALPPDAAGPADAAQPADAAARPDGSSSSMDGGTGDGGCAACNTWSITQDMPNGARRWHTATLLMDGNVLVAGGDDGTGPMRDALVFHTLTGMWEVAGQMKEPRYQHTATRLPDGRVLVTGGYGGFDANGAIIRASAEIFDPLLNAFTLVGTMAAARSGHTAVLLTDGRVLVAGGLGATTYPPEVEAAGVTADAINFTTVGNLAEPRHVHTMTSMQSGRALICAGQHITTSLDSCELFTGTGIGTATSIPGTGGWGLASVALPDGRVFLTGGYGGSARDYAAVFDYSMTFTPWSNTGALKQARWGHEMVVLTGGRIFLAGGTNGSSNDGTLKSAELAPANLSAFSLVTPMHVERLSFTLTALADGRALALGGTNNALDLLAGGEIFTPAP